MDMVDMDEIPTNTHDYDDSDEDDPAEVETASPTTASKQSKILSTNTKRSSKTQGSRKEFRPRSSSSTSSKYDPEYVASLMLQKKERKIPHSVFKPHAEEVSLLQSSLYGQVEFPKVVFCYPKYCLRNDSAASFLSTENKLFALESYSATAKCI
jgi:hypothetical protein